MCGMVGYIGAHGSKEFILEGLSRLEYRGYDSAGYACFDFSTQTIEYAKAVGQLSNLVEKLASNSISGHTGVGHTRWATHGVVSEQNTHPHFDCSRQIAVVHNGTIENHHQIAQELKKAGHVFTSQTDTEVMAHLFESLLTRHATLKESVVDLVSQLQGAYSVICLLRSMPDCILAIRKRSPLCIGIGNDEMFISSDPFSFANKTNKVLFLPDETFAIIKKSTIELYNFAGQALPVNVQTIDIQWDDHEKKGHQHFMLKEIYEQKGAIHATVDFLNGLGFSIFDTLGLTPDQIVNLKHIALIGCGTSWHAAHIAQIFFEQVCGIPTTVYLASEFRHKKFFPQPDSVYIFISQSGETADTLDAMRMVRENSTAVCMGLTNISSSTIARQADGVLLTKAGMEVSVASTKAFVAQLAALYWFAHFIAHQKGLITQAQVENAHKDLSTAAQVLEDSIERYKAIIVNDYARQFAPYKQAIFLGRQISYVLALEAALKLKELAYIFTLTYPAGELKHGPLALVEKGLPIFIFSHQDHAIYQKMMVSAQEVKARGGHIVAFAFEGQDELCDLAEIAFVIPKVNPLLGPLAMTGLVHFLTYCIAKELGHPIDKPRNLAKSVTVE